MEHNVYFVRNSIACICTSQSNLNAAICKCSARMSYYAQRDLHIQNLIWFYTVVQHVRYPKSASMILT